MIYDPVDIRISASNKRRQVWRKWWCCFFLGGGGGGGGAGPPPPPPPPPPPGHTDPHPESATEGESNERFSRSVESATNLVETLFSKKKCLEA